MAIDKESCIAFGTYTNKAKNQKNFEFKDNIMAGCVYAGMTAPTIETCGGTFDHYKGNVAHSSTRYGIYGYVNPLAAKGSECAEWGHFAAYKTQENCMVSVMKTKKQVAHHMTCIDTQWGISVNYGGAETEAADVEVNDSFFFGETAAEDCPTKDNCWCKKKSSVWSSHVNLDGKDFHPTSSSALPISKSKAQGAWGGRIFFKRNTFKNFIGKSKCGEKSVIFEGNKYDSDKTPQHYFSDSTFTDVDDSGWAFLSKPPTAWANVKDCGDFPCTAPNNLIFTFTNTKFTGDTKPK